MRDNMGPGVDVHFFVAHLPKRRLEGEASTKRLVNTETCDWHQHVALSPLALYYQYPC